MPESEGFNTQMVQAEYEIISQRSMSLNDSFDRYFGPEFGKRRVDLALDMAKDVILNATTYTEIDHKLARSHDFLGRVTEMSKKSPDSAVEFLYSTLLRRNADEEGKKAYVAQLSSGSPVENVIADITGSSEYRRKAVIQLYSELLRRAPDETGYKDKFGSNKNIGELAAEIRQSKEYQKVMGPLQRRLPIDIDITFKGRPVLRVK